MLDAFSKRNEEQLRRLWIEGRPMRNRKRLEQAVMRTWFDKLMDKYPGDVTNFITSMAQLACLREDLALARTFGGQLPRDAITQALPQERVQAFLDVHRRESDLMSLAERASARFARAAWIAAIQDGCTEVQVLAHSLGTLVAYHAMNQASSLRGAVAGLGTPAARLTRFHTIGCPLEKIHFFWPRLITPRRDKPSLVGQGPDDSKVAIDVHPEFKWMNYYSGSDKVSGALTRFQGWQGVVNHRLAGLGGVLSAHVAYKHNASFLCALGKQLGASFEAPRGGGLRPALGWIWSTSQLVLLPLLTIAICFFGLALLAVFSLLTAGLLTGLISGLGFVLQWLFTDSGAFQWYGRLFLWAAIFFCASIALLIALYVPAWARGVAQVSVARWWRRVN
jgi:hypothetical protein